MNKKQWILIIFLLFNILFCVFQNEIIGAEKDDFVVTINTTLHAKIKMLPTIKTISGDAKNLFNNKQNTLWKAKLKNSDDTWPYNPDLEIVFNEPSFISKIEILLPSTQNLSIFVIPIIAGVGESWNIEEEKADSKKLSFSFEGIRPFKLDGISLKFLGLTSEISIDNISIKEGNIDSFKPKFSWVELQKILRKTTVKTSVGWDFLPSIQQDKTLDFKDSILRDLAYYALKGNKKAAQLILKFNTSWIADAEYFEAEIIRPFKAQYKVYQSGHLADQKKKESK